MEREKDLVNAASEEEKAKLRKQIEDLEKNRIKEQDETNKKIEEMEKAAEEAKRKQDELTGEIKEKLEKSQQELADQKDEFDKQNKKLSTRWGKRLGIGGGFKTRKYSFKKLPKRKKRNNKVNNTSAKRGKKLNRSKKMKH